MAFALPPDHLQSVSWSYLQYMHFKQFETSKSLVQEFSSYFSWYELWTNCICDPLGTQTNLPEILSSIWLARIYWQMVNVTHHFHTAEEFWAQRTCSYSRPMLCLYFLCLEQKLASLCGSNTGKEKQETSTERKWILWELRKCTYFADSIFDDVRVKEYLKKIPLNNLESKALFIIVSC